MIPNDKDIDWKLIWQKQAMYPALVNELMRISFVVHRFFMDEANGGIVRSIARKAETWSKCRELRYSLSDEFISSLISKSETKQEEVAAKKEHRLNNNIDAPVELFNLGEIYWRNVYSALSKEGILSYGDLSFISSIADYIKRSSLPTSAQSKRLLKIIEKAEDKGFIMP